MAFSKSDFVTLSGATLAPHASAGESLFTEVETLRFTQGDMSKSKLLDLCQAIMRKP
jgi:hypothetical protein